MANKYETLTELFAAIAEKIRKKTGTVEAIVADNFPETLETILTPADGSIPTKTVNDMTVSGATVTASAGYYEAPASKSVNTTEQATPSISVDAAGLITASAEQAEGYVSAGNKSNTKQLPTQAGKTVMPSAKEQTAVDGGVYTTGTVKVAGDANLKAENIAKGVSIFGVAGTHSDGGNVPRMVTVTVTFVRRDDIVVRYWDSTWELCEYWSEEGDDTPHTFEVAEGFVITSPGGDGAEVYGEYDGIIGSPGYDYSIIRFTSDSGSIEYLS